MKQRVFSLEEKIAAVDMEIKEIRPEARQDESSALFRQYQILKTICADLRARQALPRNNALGALEREMRRLEDQKTENGYPPGLMIGLAQMVVSKWHIISQALEQYGELSAE